MKGVLYLKREKNKWNRISFDSLFKIYDAQVITAEYLIDNIDLAFEVWRKYPWNRNLPFDDFCELILPYRIADEPLSDWRKLYYEDYGTLLDSLYKGMMLLKLLRSLTETEKAVLHLQY